MSCSEGNAKGSWFGELQMHLTFFRLGRLGTVFSEPCSCLPQVQERFLADGNDRLKLVVLLCGEDDDKVQNAAAGALAMLTAAHKKLCLKMTQVVRAGPGDRKGWMGSRESPHSQTTPDDPLGRPTPKETSHSR